MKQIMRKKPPKNDVLESIKILNKPTTKKKILEIAAKIEDCIKERENVSRQLTEQERKKFDENTDKLRKLLKTALDCRLNGQKKG